MASSPPFILLDRDGTIIEERHYLSDPQQVVLLPGAVEGLRRLQQRGCQLIVVTNQSGVGRGLFSMAQLDAVHARMGELLDEAGVTLVDILVCPHTPDDHCDCRKPLTGMVVRGAAKWQFDPTTAFVIGDKACDIDLGRNVGARTILVRTGYGRTEALNPAVKPDVVVDDLSAAASWIVLAAGLAPA